MRTLAEIDIWYDEEINKALLQGKSMTEAMYGILREVERERRDDTIAIKMLRKNYPSEMIAEILGLTYRSGRTTFITPT